MKRERSSLWLIRGSLVVVVVAATVSAAAVVVGTSKAGNVLPC